MFETINDLIKTSRENGCDFFDKERQKEFQTKVLPTLYGGKYFITETVHRGKLLYSIYKAHKDGACDIVRGEVFLSERSAQRYLKIAILDNETEEESDELQ